MTRNVGKFKKRCQSHPGTHAAAKSSETTTQSPRNLNKIMRSPGVVSLEGQQYLGPTKSMISLSITSRGR